MKDLVVSLFEVTFYLYNKSCMARNVRMEPNIVERLTKKAENDSFSN